MKKTWSRRRFLTYGGLATASMLGYARFVEPYWVEVVERPMEIANLPPHWAGKRLVHATDLHISPQVFDGYIARVFNLIDSFSPDLVLYTGDLVSKNSDLQSHVPKVLEGLALGRTGTFSILGNHDYGFHWGNESFATRVSQISQNAGATVLRNQQAELDGLHIIGLDDLWANAFAPEKVLPDVPVTAPAVLMVHNPDTVEIPKWAGYSGWILAGHTHGGQCKAPYLPPPKLPIGNRKYASGHFELTDGRNLYVSRGIGHTLPFRFNVRPEITVYTLQPKPELSST